MAYPVVARMIAKYSGMKADFEFLRNCGALNKSFDRLRACPGLDPGTSGKLLIPFVVSLSNHERNTLIQRFPNHLFF